jgi:hypothetical protein
MAEVLEHAAPVMGRPAGLEQHLGRRLGREEGAKATRDSRWRVRTWPGTGERAISKTDLARSTPICRLDIGSSSGVWPFRAVEIAARWCHSGRSPSHHLLLTVRGG